MPNELCVGGVRCSSMEDLSEFQWNVLTVVSGDAVYGLGIKRELELYYGEEINHSRLYPNLDELVERGLLRKEARDDRTNEYELTERGREVLKRHVVWKLKGYVGDDDSRRGEMERVLQDPVER